jgi:hypothetical protein
MVALTGHYCSSHLIEYKSKGFLKFQQQQQQIRARVAQISKLSVRFAAGS